MAVKVKICGITTKEAAEAAVESGTHYIGFVIHPPSPRALTASQAATLKARIPPHIKTVAVCVDPSDALLAEITEILAPGFLQLHGGETPERTAEIKRRFHIPVIKGLGIRSAADLDAIPDVAAYADMLLLDAHADSPEMPGGTGRVFDWSLLAGRTIPLPWFLSGGLNAANLVEAVRATGATLVDVSSGVESSRGVKDPDKIRAFLRLASGNMG